MGNAIVQSATIQLKDQGGGVYGSVTPVSGNGITVTGTIGEGEVVVISKPSGGFGNSGPEKYFYEDFSNGVAGEDATLFTTSFDELHASYPPEFVVDDVSGRLVARMFRQDTAGSENYQPCKAKWLNLGVIREAFKSFSVRVPPTKYFSGPGGGNSGTDADYSSASSWKMDWLVGDNTINTNDLITASHVGNGQWTGGGNALQLPGGGQLQQFGTNPTWWKWGKWHRMTQWIKAGAVPEVDAGNMYTQIANGEEAMTIFDTTPVIFATGASPYSFKEYHINGWAVGDATNNPNIEQHYKSIYLAVGDNAAARVELSNDFPYLSGKKPSMCEAPDVGWTDNEITVTLHDGTGDVDLTKNTWAYITLPDNVTQFYVQVVTV